MFHGPYIPLVDLNKLHLTLKSEINSAVAECIAEGNFIKGERVSDFERAFANYSGTKFCVGCGNGTDALELILKSLGIGRGDEVIVPALTWIATAEAVSNVGAEPVFADIRESDFTIDPDSASALVTGRTRALIAVHLYGTPCEMDELVTLSAKNNIYLIEDCAQAHGAEYRGKKAGSFGIASAYSFFPSKNLGAFGDAGAVVTSNSELADNVRMLANHGQLAVRHNHRIIGRNSRLDTLQAAILLVKLPHLDKWNEIRIAAANKYSEFLKGTTSLELPMLDDHRKQVFHLFVVRSSLRDKLQAELGKNNIGCGIHYPQALPFTDAYGYKRHAESEFPVAVSCTKKILSVPIYPYLEDSEIFTVSEILKRSLKC